MVDPCEDNFRMKHKLEKNLHGLDYLPNFLTNVRENARLASNKASVVTTATTGGETMASSDTSRTNSSSSILERFLEFLIFCCVLTLLFSYVNHLVLCRNFFKCIISHILSVSVRTIKILISCGKS